MLVVDNIMVLLACQPVFCRQDPTLSGQDCTLLIPTYHRLWTDEWIERGWMHGGLCMHFSQSCAFFLSVPGGQRSKVSVPLKLPREAGEG